MVKTENDSIPTSIAPWLSVQNGAKAVEFYKSAFGAVEKYRLETPGGLVVKLSIDRAEFWISDGESNDEKSTIPLGGETIRLILVVADPHPLFNKALKAGATEVFPVGDDHGWRLGRLVDPSDFIGRLDIRLSKLPVQRSSQFQLDYQIDAMKKMLILIYLIFPFQCLQLLPAQDHKPLRVGVAGLTHGHVGWILNYKKNDIVEIVGIAEPNRDLAERMSKQYGFSMDLVYSSLDEMLDKKKPEAVTAFNSIYQHLDVVKSCAPRGVHVMVEKPLTYRLDHAKQMEALAKQYGIKLLTNYETTWYGSNQKAYQLVHTEQAIGAIRKIVVHDGHPGPKEIGVGPDFLNWLTDPVQNGGGAIVDFGCYGADLITWMMRGERPITVTAVTQQMKPDIYPNVDDEATIIVTYPHTQGIIQASWNWPVSRKDMEVYGQTGYAITIDALNMRIRKNEKEKEVSFAAEPTLFPQNDPFAYLAAVVRGDIQSTDDLSSLKTNMIVVEILDAARKSAKEGKTVYLDK